MIDTSPHPVLNPVTRQGWVARRFEENAAMFMAAARSAYPETVERAAECIANALVTGRKLLVFGNGGSASDAQHLCGELVVRFENRRRALPAIALVVDAAVLTACANDFSYEHVFARQIEGLGAPGDVALGISTSGTSANVLAGLRAARGIGMITILLTGPERIGVLREADIVLAAPGSNTARIQELHLASYHAICEAVDARVLAEDAKIG